MAIPLAAQDKPSYFLVLFQSVEAVSPPLAASDRAAIDFAARGMREGREVADLQRQLDSMGEHTQALLQGRDIAVEELRAANEEIQSSNEELQSINEELETAKEELQSTNEELRTVNEELERRNSQLSRANDDLNNLLRAVNVPTIMVGRDLRIRHYTPGAEQVMNLIPTDIGRPLTDIAPRFALPDLGPVIANVIDNIFVERRELTDSNGRWYSMTVRPYQTQDNRIEDAVLTLVDIDEQCTTQARATLSVRLLEGIARWLGSTPEAGRLVQSLLTETVKALPADLGAVLVRSGSTWTLRAAEGPVSAPSESSWETAQLPAPLVTLDKAAQALTDPQVPNLSFLSAAEVELVVLAPLHDQERVAGMLLLGWTHRDVASMRADVDLATRIATVISLAVFDGEKG